MLFRSGGAIVIDSEPLFHVSPHLHMKFMEALGVAVKSAPPSLDSAASRSRSTLSLHVTNMSFSGAVEVSFVVEGVVAPGGRVPEISPENPCHEISPMGPEVFRPRKQALPTGDSTNWRFPSQSLSMVELDCRIA